MPQIFQMPPQLANLIAAGEVVERPGSVVKELVENAVDAGAKHITVEIKHGGVTYLRVTDDGKGILPEDVRTAFLRHATSKIRTEADLEMIGTLGFRGEALAAISSVARVDLFTRTKGNTEGVQITIEGGEETGYGETGCPVGTTVVIRDLFFNVPARAKFLKKDTTEGAYVENIVTQIAVSQPQVAFKFIKDGRESFSTPGDGKMLSAVYAAGGKDLAGRMLSVQTTMGEIRVNGYISPPEITRATRAQQNFYINGRFVRSRVLTAALEEAYKGRLMGGRYPVCYLKMELHPAAVDVNVHPAKLEVKLSLEKEVFSALEGGDSVREIKAATRAREDHLTGMQQTLPLGNAAAPGKKPVPVMAETFEKTRLKVADSQKLAPYRTLRDELGEDAPALVRPELKRLKAEIIEPPPSNYAISPGRLPNIPPEKMPEKIPYMPAVKQENLPVEKPVPTPAPVPDPAPAAEKPAEVKPAVRVLGDEWTVVTADGSLSAHYENTILITNGEPEILTMADDI